MSLETNRSDASAVEQQKPPRFLQVHHQRAILRHMVKGSSLSSLVQDEGFMTSFQPHEIELFWNITAQMKEHAQQGGTIPSFLASYYDSYVVGAVRKTLIRELDDPSSVDMGVDEVIDEARIHAYYTLTRIASGSLPIDVENITLAPYLGRVGANLARDRIRHTGVRRRYIVPLETLGDEENDEGETRTPFGGISPSAEHDAFADMLWDDIRDALDGNEVKFQLVVQTALKRGMDLRDLADKTGIPYERIKMQASRARHHVRDKLARTWEDGIE